MKERIKEFLPGFLGVVAYIGFFGLVIFFASTSDANKDTANSSYSSDSPTCETVSIEYETDEEYTDELDEGDSEIVGGEEGEREVCTKDGVEVSNTVVKEPVTETTRYGTAREYYSERSGALCYDGTYSTATGRGACSWHGGVDEWLYD